MPRESGIRNRSSLVWRLQGLWQALFFAVPLAWLVLLSFRSLDNYLVTWNFGFSSYERLSSGPFRVALRNSLLTSLLAASVVALCSLAVGYSIYLIRVGRLQRFVLLIVIAPYFTNAVIRLFGWQIWINSEGPLGDYVTLYSRGSFVLGLVSLFLPIGALFVYVGLIGVESDWLLAARNLGASRWRCFLKIELPFAYSGVVASFAFSFIVSMGDYLASNLLGGSSVYTIALSLRDRMSVNDLPGAAAIGVLLLIISGLTIAVAFTVLHYLGRRDS